MTECACAAEKRLSEIGYFRLEMVEGYSIPVFKPQPPESVFLILTVGSKGIGGDFPGRPPRFRFGGAQKRDGAAGSCFSQCPL